MALHFYSKTACPFCWQIKLALSYYDLDYELTEWSEPDKDFILKYSPQATVPLILDDDIFIWDSGAIIYYLEDISDQKKTLFPGNLSDRNKARLLQTYNNSIVGKGLREVVFEKRSKPEAEWDLERIKKGEEAWNKSLDWLESEVESDSFFLTAGFSIADAALLPRFGLAEHYGVGVDEKHPRLFEWFNSLKEKDIYLDTVSLYLD
ncbi:MAG: glutathione S-transferase family protein [Gammaproteobacteria bacterium]